jgi:hypothetical protein
MVRLYSVTFALIFTFAASAAHGAIPDGKAMLTRIATTQPAPAPFVVNYVEAPTEGVALVAVRVIADGKGRARIDIQDLQGGLSRSRFFGALTQGATQSMDRAPIWLQWWMGRPVTEIVAAARVKSAIRSLSHAGGEILWVLGAGPKQPDVPQLHIERETGRLRRAVSGGDEGPVVPARLDDYMERNGAVTRFPRRLTLRLNGRDVTLVNTWMRVGEDAQIDPGEFVPATVR